MNASIQRTDTQDHSLYTADLLEANKENTDGRHEDKENVPPRDLGDTQLANPQPTCNHLNEDLLSPV